MSGLVVAVVAAVVLLLLGMSVKVVKQYEQGVLFRLGKVRDVRMPGLRLIIPVVDVMRRVSDPRWGDQRVPICGLSCSDDFSSGTRSSTNSARSSTRSAINAMRTSAYSGNGW